MLYNIRSGVMSVPLLFIDVLYEVLKNVVLLIYYFMELLYVVDEANWDPSK